MLMSRSNPPEGKVLQVQHLHGSSSVGCQPPAETAHVIPWPLSLSPQVAAQPFKAEGCRPNRPMAADMSSGRLAAHTSRHAVSIFVSTLREEETAQPER